MLTTIGPAKVPAGLHITDEIYIGTLWRSSRWRTGIPARCIAASNVKLQPSRNATKSSRHKSVIRRASPEDAVLRKIGAQVGAASHTPRMWIPWIGHFQQRTWFGIALAEKEEVIRIRRRQDHQVGLHEARRQPGGYPGPPAGADGCPHGRWVEGGEVRSFGAIHGWLPR